MSSDIIQQQKDNIQQQVELAEAGYVAFRRMFAQTNRRPEYKPYKKGNEFMRAAIGGVMIAASIVSASHTIPVFAGTMAGNLIVDFIRLGVGIAAFIMGEMALAVFAYTGVMRHFRDTGTEPETLKTLLQWGVGVPVVIMIAANISHQFSTSGQYIDPRIMSGIQLAIALAAPFMAYISGEVFATVEVGERIDEAKHKKTYAEDEERWEERCRAAWDRNKHNYGGKIRIDPVPVPQIGLSNVLSDQTRQDKTQTDMRQTGAMGFTRVSMAVDTARQWFEANPEQIDLPLRALEPLIGVSKDSIAKARNQIKNEG